MVSTGKTNQNNLNDIEAGLKPAVICRPAYEPYRKHLKYTGFLALYVHYLYILSKIEKRKYPSRMTSKMRKNIIDLFGNLAKGDKTRYNWP